MPFGEMRRPVLTVCTFSSGRPETLYGCPSFLDSNIIGWMNLKVHTRNFQRFPAFSKVMERQTQKIRKLLPTFSSDALNLHVTVGKLARGRQFRTSLVLGMSQRTFRVEEIETNPTMSILRAYGELLRRVKKFKSQLNREHFWRRQATLPAPAPTSPMPASTQPETDLNFERIENYICRELFHQIALEKFPPGIIQRQALLDEIFLQVQSEKNRPENLSSEQWTFQVARQTVQARVEELNQSRKDAHLEEVAPRLSPWDDEELNFYQPDEVLRLEGLRDDAHSATPEKLLQLEETEVQIQHAIARLPNPIRESFVLFALEGFNSDEVAMITGQTSEKVLLHVERARNKLKEELALIRQADHPQSSKSQPRIS